jgi:hypothetical protein
VELAGSRSWRIAWGDDLAAVTALYVRDALALSVSELPLLDPPVPVSAPDGVDREAVAREWPGWWADALARVVADWSEPRERFLSMPVRPESPALAARPAIRAAVEIFSLDASRYRDALKPRGGPPPHTRGIGDLVRAREAELGRKARPFRLTVTELPLDGLVWHRRTPEHVLISTRFAMDGERRDTALREIIAELA